MNGSLEVICGSMFSGKSEELIRRIKRVKYAKQSYIVFKINIDDRYHKDNVVTHDGIQVNAIPVRNIDEIKKYLYDNKVDVIGIDEVTFFENEIVELIDDLANNGYRVVVSGLDQDFLGRPFQIMANLLAIADKIDKLHAVCLGCGGVACKSHRLSKNKDIIQIGSSEMYEPLCRKCYINKTKE